MLSFGTAIEIDHSLVVLEISGDLPPQSAKCIPIRPQTVHIWGFDLRAFEPRLGRSRAILGTEELERSNGFVFRKDRTAYILRHAILRHLTGAYVGIPPSRVEFEPSPHGKPALKSGLNDQPVTFNMASSWPVVLIALSPDHEIGVDVERIRPLEEASAIARSFFSRSELAALELASAGERQGIFFKIWTRKESLLKATGVGLSTAFEAEGSFSHPMPSDQGAWACSDLDIGPAFAASVCAPRGWAIEPHAIPFNP